MTIDIELKGEYKQRNVSQDISSSGLKKNVITNKIQTEKREVSSFKYITFMDK